MTRISILFACICLLNCCKISAQDDYVSPVGHEHGNQSRAALRGGFKAAAEKDFEKFMATAGPRYIQHSPDLPDGWKPVWDLLAKRPKGFSSKPMTWIGPDGFLDNGNYLVMLREVDRGNDDQKSKVVDIMIFDDDGKYTEHWDIRQPLANKTPAGRSETESAKRFASNAVIYSIETEERNKLIVTTFLNAAFNEGKFESALKKYIAEDFIQHSPNIPDGSTAMAILLQSGKMSQSTYDVQLVLSQNDIVIVYSKVTVAKREMAVVDLFRVRDGLVVEHWDVSQEVPMPIDMPHTNGMFNIPELPRKGD